MKSKTVLELSQDELEELKWTYFHEVDNYYATPFQIPNEVIFDYYGHISFVDEDFCCNL